jgi:hypothetical protein
MSTRARLGVPLVVLGLLVTACAPYKGMRAVPAEQLDARPPADQAAVVFTRWRTGGMVSTSLFELREPPDRFIGILVSESQLRYLTAPGRTRFMVVGHSASFLDAELAAGKTYHVAVAPGDFGQGLFVLRPLTDADWSQREVRECLRSCPWLTNTPKSEEWARLESSSLQRKKERYLPAWERREDRPVLRREDGR